MKAIQIPDGVLHMRETEFPCPYCKALIGPKHYARFFARTKSWSVNLTCWSCRGKMLVVEDFLGDVKGVKP